MCSSGRVQGKQKEDFQIANMSTLKHPNTLDLRNRLLPSKITPQRPVLHQPLLAPPLSQSTSHRNRIRFIFFTRQTTLQFTPRGFLRAVPAAAGKAPTPPSLRFPLDASAAVAAG